MYFYANLPICVFLFLRGNHSFGKGGNLVCQFFPVFSLKQIFQVILKLRAAFLKSRGFVNFCFFLVFIHTQPHTYPIVPEQIITFFDFHYTLSHMCPIHVSNWPHTNNETNIHEIVWTMGPGGDLTTDVTVDNTYI